VTVARPDHIGTSTHRSEPALTLARRGTIAPDEHGVIDVVYQSATGATQQAAGQQIESSTQDYNHIGATRASQHLQTVSE
jgi:hypothetical protein